MKGNELRSDDEFTAVLQSDPTCGRCGGALPPPEHEEFPLQREGGLVVRLDGGYGMFHDILDSQCRINIYLCHHCAVGLMDFMGFNPNYDQKFRGLHPYDEPGDPCCDYGWTSGSQGTVFGYEDQDPRTPGLI